MFIISLNYISEIKNIETHLESHVNYLKEQYQLRNFIASGRKVPRTGGIIMSNLKNKTVIEELIKQDPFYQNNLAEYTITEFVPTMTSKELEFLKK